MAPGRKTGGRIRGVSKNKPKPIIMEPTDENRALALMAPTAEVRTPKAVMLSAMLKFERMSDVLMAKAERMTGDKAAYEDIKQVIAEAHKFTVAAVNCADRVAPYIHARLLAVESRGDMTQDRAPFVLRAPAVMVDSAAWQEAVGAAVLDMEAQSAQNLPVVRQTEVTATPIAQTQETAPAASPVALAVSPDTGRITVMPPGPRVVQPSGSDEWLAAVTAERRKAAG